MNPADKVEKWKISKLIPYARNARTHSDEQVGQIAASIKEWGWTTPVLVDEEGGIIAGHGRTLAAQKLGMTEVPVMVAKGWSEAKKRAYVLADNKLALNAGWDNEMLALELGELGDLGFDLDLTGFTADEIAALMPEQIEAGLTDEDAVPEVPEQPVTVLGDIWVLGKHRLMCGDSTSIDAVDKLMDGQKAEFCFTSPPYADQREYNGDKELSTEHLATFIRTASGFCNFFAVNLGISRKENEINQYWDDYISEARSCGLKLLSWNIWNREGMGGSIGNMTAMFPIEHEWIFVFGSEGKDINRTRDNKYGGISGKSTIRQKGGETTPNNWEINKKGKIGTVFTCDFARGKKEHPAMFPVEFPVGYIESCTNSNDIVYEPFGGAGSTMIACEKLKRQARLIELDPKYCDVIVKRWQDFTGKIAIHAETGQPFAEVTHEKQEASH
jgi:DNA modification methylase